MDRCTMSNAVSHLSPHGPVLGVYNWDPDPHALFSTTMISAGPAGASNHPAHLRPGDCGRVSELSDIWTIWSIERRLTTGKGWMSTLVMKSDHRKLHNILIRRSIEKYLQWRRKHGVSGVSWPPTFWSTGSSGVRATKFQITGSMDLIWICASWKCIHWIHFQLAQIHISHSICRLLYYDISCGWSAGCAVDSQPHSSRSCIRILPAELIRSSHWRQGGPWCVGHPDDEVVHSFIWKFYRLLRHWKCLL